MDANSLQILGKIANTIRVLSAEGVEKANSGHPGLPMGCAELGAYLFGRELRFNPKNPHWLGRDRFVLSAGHGSMFLYTSLHLSGYDVSMDDIKNFRQFHSITPGHPEYGETPGVETTTGPLGQGLAAATGMAIAQKMLAARFDEELFTGKVFSLCGDGCMMEGIASEAASLAGHLALNNLVVIYDSNSICLDGPTSECFSENTAQRYEAYGFNVITIDGNDLEQIDRAFTAAREEKDRPTLIVAHTIIGKGAPDKQGKNSSHGSPLGADELKKVKQALGWPEEPFFVPAEVRQYFAERLPARAKLEADWNVKLEAMKKASPEKAALWDIYDGRKLPEGFADQIWNLAMEPGKATRSQSQAVIGKIAEILPFFLSGSADLSCSDNSNIKKSGFINRNDFTQRNIKFGVREFSMAAACTGIGLSGMLQPMCATFFTFSDYMRNAIRVAALMKQRVFFQFTHDSVFLGEDGPTHQPVEHLAALRAMPNLTVIRPADENETKAAWIEAFNVEGPVALVLSRQNMKNLSELTQPAARQGMARGAYHLYGPAQGAVDVLLLATGSEVGLAVDAAKLLESQGKSARVISMPSWELFEAQDEAYKASILGGEAGLRVSIEAGCEQGWHKYIGSEGLAIAINQFGLSAPAKAIAEFFGLTPQKVVERILAALPANV